MIHTNPSTMQLSEDQQTILIHIPVTFRRKGGRKMVIVPEGKEIPMREAKTIDDAMLKAIARAHRWSRMLEEGKADSITDLAKKEKFAKTYVSRLLRLITLAPDITESILFGRHPKHLMLADILKPFPIEWKAQREFFDM